MIGLTTLKNKILINIFICLNPLTRCVCVSSAARAAVGKSADRGVFFLMGFNFAVKFFLFILFYGILFWWWFCASARVCVCVGARACVELGVALAHSPLK